MRAAEPSGALVACGAGTDHLPPAPGLDIARAIGAYEEQIGTVEAAGGRIVLMASRALAAAAKSPDDYIRVYDRILAQVKEPVVIHWLGEMFDPAACAALSALGRGSQNEFFDILEPTVPLSRHIFRAPTRFYKTGVVFLAYLNGLQDHFVMVGGQQGARAARSRSGGGADEAGSGGSWARLSRGRRASVGRVSEA